MTGRLPPGMPTQVAIHDFPRRPPQVVDAVLRRHDDKRAATGISSALFVAAMLAATAAPALAADTHLHLSESATVTVSPDEIAGFLRAEATASTAAEVQKRVNDQMRDAVAAAKDTPGVAVTTGGYAVWRTVQNGTDRWQGSQSLSLTATDGAALLKLVGTLQQKGLALSGLNWRLARETERKARLEATQKALTTLRVRVDEAAAALDLRFGQFADVRLDSAPNQPLRAMPALAMSSRMADAPPTAVAEDIPVTASVEADAILLPR